MSRARFAVLLSALLLFSLGLRLYRLGVPPGYYFDEVYSAFTARAYLHGEKDSYFPRASHPEGAGYQWVHPPLAGLLMAAGMKAGGERPEAWRFGSALAGAAAVGLTAALALELFASPAAALLAAFFLSVDGLSFTQSRIATNDSYFAAFALLAVWAWARWRKDPGSLGKLLLAGFSIGLAISTKWTGVFLYGIIAADLTVERFTAKTGEATARSGAAAARLAACLVAVPALVYLASYSQFFLLGWGWGDFIAVQREMWLYHTRLTETHSFASGPFQWLLNLRPVWFYVDRSLPGLEANIYNTGNSVVYFAGLAAAAAAAARSAGRPELRLPLAAWLLFWAPWLLSPRVMFFYHYTPAVPFLCVLLGWAAEGARNPSLPGALVLPGGRAVSRALILLAFLWFALFYPLHTAVPLPQGAVKNGFLSLPG